MSHFSDLETVSGIVRGQKLDGGLILGDFLQKVEPGFQKVLGVHDLKKKKSLWFSLTKTLKHELQKGLKLRQRKQA